MESNVDILVRQAGAIYLKNVVTASWQDRETKPGEPMPFAVHEQDRTVIRENIVDAIVHAPELIR